MAANKVIIQFATYFKGGGSSDTLTINLNTQPISLFPFGGAASQLSSLSALSSSLPSDIYGTSCAGLTVSSQDVSLGIITIKFSSNPVNNTEYLVVGTLVF